MIVNATPNMLASQRRVRERAARTLARLAAERRTGEGNHALLYLRPDLYELTLPGAVMHELSRWAA